MKSTKRVLMAALVLVFMFTVVMSSAVFAVPNNDKGNGKDTTTEKVKDIDKEKGIDKVKNTEGSTVETEEEKAVKEKDKVMEHKKELTKQLIDARKSGNTEAEAQLLIQLKQYKEQLKEMVRNSYTQEEMVQLQLVTENIETADPTLEVLPVDKIIAKGKSLKLDMPPVIKDGKVLVPVRAFSQAYGAEVKWNPEDHTIIILKDGMEIILKTDSSIVTVNGVETDLGLPVKAINGRNVISVGFLAEKLGLKMEIDEEDGTIEIDEEVAEVQV